MLLIPIVGITTFIVTNRIAFMLLAIGIGAMMYVSGTTKYLIMITSACLLQGLLESLQMLSLSILLVTLIYVLQRLMLFAMLGASITETLTVGEVICTLEKFKLPQNVVIPFTVTLRFLPTVKQEFSYIKESMSIRGIETNFKGFLKHPIKWGEYMLVPILMRSFKIADELSAAAFLALGTIYMVIVAKVKKRGTYLICGLLMSIIGLIGGRINTTLGCIAGGIVAELLVGNYTSIKRIIIAYCSYAVGMALGIYLPAFIMGVNYLQSLKVM